MRTRQPSFKTATLFARAVRTKGSKLRHQKAVVDVKIGHRHPRIGENSTHNKHLNQHTIFIYPIIFICSHETTVRTHKRNAPTWLSMGHSLALCKVDFSRGWKGVWSVPDTSREREPSWSHAGDLDHVMPMVRPSLRVLSKTKCRNNVDQYPSMSSTTPALSSRATRASECRWHLRKQAQVDLL